jgi:hypothetical protein
MTRLPVVMVASEPSAGGIAPQPGFLPPCLLASQSLVTFHHRWPFSRAIEGKGRYNEGAVG